MSDDLKAKKSRNDTSADAKQLRKLIENHPDYEVLKQMVVGGSGLSADEVIDIIVDVVAKNKKK